MSVDRVVLVWGNCQAEPIAALLTEPLAQLGFTVHQVPAVYLADAADVDRVRGLVRRAAFLIGQPIRDEYRVPGAGTAQLAALLPPSGRLLTFPVAFHTGLFPYQVNAHGGDGVRVLAPVTDYHDLRAVVAAERGLAVDEALAWWPEPTPAAVAQIAAASVAELRRRESGLDVAVSDLVDKPDAMWTISHPRNALLARVAGALLAMMGIPAEVSVPAREFLGARRAPLEPAVLHGHGWPVDAASSYWVVDGRRLGQAELLAAQLSFYAERPDVVIDCRSRYADRLHTLEL